MPSSSSSSSSSSCSEDHHKPAPPQPSTNQVYPNPGGASPYPAQSPPQPVYVQSQPAVVIASPAYGPHPVQVQCPHCHQQVMTHVRYNPGLLAWIICGACIFFGCILGCCLIPFFVDDCQDCEHQCPNCHVVLGQHKRI